MEDVFAVIFIFGTPALIVLIVFGFRLLRYSQRQRSLRLAIEKGIDFSPLLAEEVAASLDSRRYVLYGLLWGLTGLLVGVGVTWAAIRHDIPPYVSMFGWIPAAVGVAYLIYYRWGVAQAKGSDSTAPSDPSLAVRHDGRE